MFKKLLGLLSLIKYPINDPTTPDLTADLVMPKVGLLKYAVKGMTPAPKNRDETRALNCHVSMGNCIEQIQNKFKVPLRKWAATEFLSVYPDAGNEMNAYYDRRSLKFFKYRFEGKNYYFSDSSDIVTHELGHAVLDAMRPDFWSVQSLEIWSFHEAFSDIVAMVNVMNYEIALKKVLEETKGNLLVSNTVSRLAEEVGLLIRRVTGDSAYLANALRDPAVEKFLYVDPARLPKETKNNMLAAECHSFGRVFSNAWYHILVRIYENNVAQGKDRLISLKEARDSAFSILLEAIPTSARVVNYYCNIAKSMVAVAQVKNPTHAKIIKEVFLEWQIIPHSEMKILSSTDWKQVVRQLKKDDKVLKTKYGTTVCVRSNKTVKMSSLPMVSGLSLEKDVDVEIPSDTFYQFDETGNLIEEMRDDETILKNSVAKCVLSISNNIGSKSMWNIEDNKLVRKFIV